MSTHARAFTEPSKCSLLQQLPLQTPLHHSQAAPSTIPQLLHLDEKTLSISAAALPLSLRSAGAMQVYQFVTRPDIDKFVPKRLQHYLPNGNLFYIDIIEYDPRLLQGSPFQLRVTSIPPIFPNKVGASDRPSASAVADLLSLLAAMKRRRDAQRPIPAQQRNHDRTRFFPPCAWSHVLLLFSDLHLLRSTAQPQMLSCCSVCLIALRERLTQAFAAFSLDTAASTYSRTLPPTAHVGSHCLPSDDPSARLQALTVTMLPPCTQAHIACTLTIEEETHETCRQTLEGDVDIRIFGLGALAERIIADNLKKVYSGIPPIVAR